MFCQLRWRLDALHQLAEVTCVVFEILLHARLVHCEPINDSTQKLKLALLHSFDILDALELALSVHLVEILALLCRALVDPFYSVPLDLHLGNVYALVSINELLHKAVSFLSLPYVIILV